MKAFRKKTRVTNSSSVNSKTEEGVGVGDPVSIWYFRAAMVAWFSTPFLVMPFALNNRLFSSKRFPMKWFAQSCYPPIFYLCKTVICFAASVAYVYIVIPLADLIAYLGRMFGEFSDQDRELHDVIRASKLFEQFGEAIPQGGAHILCHHLRGSWKDGKVREFGRNL